MASGLRKQLRSGENMPGGPDSDFCGLAGRHRGYYLAGLLESTHEQGTSGVHRRTQRHDHCFIFNRQCADRLHLESLIVVMRTRPNGIAARNDQRPEA